MEKSRTKSERIYRGTQQSNLLPDKKHKKAAKNGGYRGPRTTLKLPATETQTGIVLAFCIFAMSVMSIVLVWQAQIIAKQNAVIRMFESRLGG